MVQISTATLVTIALSILGVFSGIIFLLVRTLTKSAHQAMIRELNGFKERLSSSIDNVKEARDDCEERCSSGLNGFSVKYESMRDKWESFLEKYTMLDATRGQKVEALFRNIDEMKATIRDLKPALFRKVESMLRDMERETRRYVKEMTDG